MDGYGMGVRTRRTGGYTGVNLGGEYWIPYLIKAVAGALAPKGQAETEQLLRGLAVISEPNVARTLSNLPMGQQAELHRRLFTYEPSLSRRLLRGEARKTLLWPGEKEVTTPGTAEVPPMKSTGALGDVEIPGVPAMPGTTRTEPVYFQPPTGLPWHPTSKEEYKEVHPARVPAVRGWAPASKEEYLQVHPHETKGWAPASKEEYKEVHPPAVHGWSPASKEEYKEVHPHEGKESPEDKKAAKKEFQRIKSVDAQLKKAQDNIDRGYNRYLETMKLQMREHNKTARAPRYKGDVTEPPPPIEDISELPNFMTKDDWLILHPEGKAANKEMMRLKGELHYLETEAIYPSGGPIAAPPIRPQTPAVIKYDAQGNRVQ